MTIIDFWKPSKKTTQPNKVKIADIAIGTSVTFSNMPQAVLSGQKLTVIAINSYQFGKDILTSFVLGNGKDAEVSMIVAEAQGEQYLALSRRLSANDKARLFEDDAVANITKKNDASTFLCSDNVEELRGWLVPAYKREIQGMYGTIYRKDLRGTDGGSNSIGGDEFQYTLLGSSSNEHALEIETYDNNVTDVYATVYRRISDILDISHQDKIYSDRTQFDKKLSRRIEEKIEEKIDLGFPTPLTPVLELNNLVADNNVVTDVVFGKTENDVKSDLKSKEIEKTPPKLETVKMELLSLPELIITQPAIETKEENKNERKEDKEEKKLELKNNETEITKTTEITNQKTDQKNNNEEKKDMSTTSTSANGIDLPGVPSFSSSTKDFSKEVKTMTKIANGMDHESVECELRIANQIIDEAIRNEMRLSDVVRRIIELPVSHQESVHIPLNLADEDYALLAIRYGISASDRSAIKSRIIQDLTDFSGSGKKVAK